ncbi:helix-turn-helix protein [Bifidobacterium pseudolongum subsp. globosum]|uniref:helix-turn-helix domain-containing protein n=1 Tax=Bifidobacterium pseudolongum TaxID=1694 RepID=UPI000C70DC97|nr:helix-turn-helix transcriptional regulator [Bifidobacterium pseudolongum]PKV05747.1 helix-turn-helix protein [Bifidobacterium pseudolongum subsp. globosum]RYQ56598.1 XRE family transcriptional regulator [Bifidobacterium pseudolongum subsp. globosum]RYQ60519.1 XRE family transcriptional regulator [Bifidobacterium pseudolongum subsp. globosum]
MDYTSDRFKEMRQRARQQIEENKAILHLLVRRRRNMGLTQEEIAFRLGITQPAVSAMESGNSSPTLETLGRYANALDCVVHHEIRRNSAWGVQKVSMSETKQTMSSESTWPSDSSTHPSEENKVMWQGSQGCKSSILC